MSYRIFRGGGGGGYGGMNRVESRGIGWVL